MHKSSYSIVFIFVLFIFSACGPETPTLENDEELITTLNLKLRNTETGEQHVFSFYDADGVGPILPVYNNDTLAANASYTLSIEVLNETESPAEDIGEEILDEGATHQFFYETSNGLNLEVTYDDRDINSNPIGLKAYLQTQAASGGTLKVTLRHEPNKTAEDVDNGIITNAGGETDIEAVFNVVIE